MRRETTLASVAAALRKAGYRVYTDPRAARRTPCCAVLPDGLTEKRLPMGRLLREARFAVRFYPGPLAEAVGFDPPPEGGEALNETLCRAAETLRSCLELVAAPDGLLRGRGFAFEIKDGAVAARVSYPVILRETGRRGTKMGSLDAAVRGRDA
ncbi:MAG: hypothetical protein LBH95_02955 [Oscillospiraceae bacterium]|jgi:hypothetical protein|nr:hypothetical protein [Oscillospiraceae bacterium]